MELIKIKINKYNLDLKHESDQIKYNQIVETCKNFGYKCSKTLQFQHNQTFFERLSEEAFIETAFVFKDQYNVHSLNESDEHGFRVHDWYEVIYDNRRIKKGYFLTGDIDALTEFKKQHYVCGFCGYRHNGHDAPFYCPKCVSSEYLKDEDIDAQLNTLKPLVGTRHVEISEDDKAKLKQEHIAKVESARKQRLLDFAVKLKLRAKKDKEEIDAELADNLELISKGIHPTEFEFIRYKNKGRVFGYRRGITQTQADKLNNAGLSFEFTVKLKEGQ